MTWLGWLLILYLKLDPPLTDTLHVHVARAVLALHPDRAMAATLRDLIERESSWRPWVVSRRGACGLAQIRPAVWGGTCRDYATRPLLTLATAERIVRQYQRTHGKRWLLAYQYGPNHPVTRARRR
jgi:hypothetical protein